MGANTITKALRVGSPIGGSAEGSVLMVGTDLAVAQDTADRQATGSTNNVGLTLRIYRNGFATFPFLSGRSANGTRALPTKTLSGDILMRFGGAGHTGSAFAGANRASVDFVAAEDWSTTAQGTRQVFYTTPTGSTTLTERLQITAAGVFLVWDGASIQAGTVTGLLIGTSPT